MAAMVPSSIPSRTRPSFFRIATSCSVSAAICNAGGGNCDKLYKSYNAGPATNEAFSALLEFFMSQWGSRSYKHLSGRETEDMTVKPRQGRHRHCSFIYTELRGKTLRLVLQYTCRNIGASDGGIITSTPVSSTSSKSSLTSSVLISILPILQNNNETNLSKLL
jgi:hypothetical protein